MNAGYVGSEIAEMIEMRPAMDKSWHCQGFYGSTHHNVKAIYQLYLGWYDGNPAHLWQHPPEAAGARYVEVIGGGSATVIKAKEHLDRGDLRFAAELASHAVFADQYNVAAKDLLASIFERLGYGSENAVWRYCFLQGAQELRTNKIGHTDVNSARMAPAMTVTQLFDMIAVRVNGPKAWSERFSINWHLTDENARYRIELSNGALIHFLTKVKQDSDATITLNRPQLLSFITTGAIDKLKIEGDGSVLGKLLDLLDTPDFDFAIVTP